MLEFFCKPICIAVLSLPKDDASVAQFTQSKAKGTLVRSEILLSITVSIFFKYLIGLKKETFMCR